MLQDLSAITNIDQFDFPVEVREMNFPGDTRVPGAGGLVVRRNEPIPPSMARVVVRTDTEQPLGIVGPNWKLVSYGDMLRAFNDQLVASGLDLEDAQIHDEVFENGAKMRRSIVLRRHVIRPQVGDIAGLRLRIFDSYNMNWARQMIADVLRYWCSNGCYHPLLSHRFYSKHTRNLGHIEFTAAEAAKTVANLKLVEESMGKWIATPVNEQGAKEIYAHTIATYRNQKGELAVNDKLVNALVENFHGQKLLGGSNWTRHSADNLYNVYQGATAWATHVGESRRGAVHNIQRARETQVRDMVKSEIWRQYAYLR